MGNLFPKKDLQSQLWNVMPEINSGNVSSATRNIINMSSLVSAGQSTWQQLYDTKPADQKYLVRLGQQMEGLIITEQEVIRTNQAMRQSALNHNAALKAQTLSARAGKMAFQALSAAGNMLLFTAVMEGVQFVVNAVDSWIHADEIALEKAEDAQSRIDDLNSSYKSHRDTAEELGASYDRLSKGVDTTNNKNLSLSDKDYKSYLDITNQLAETFPTLRNGIDDNGNALLTLGQNGRTAAEDLEELLKAEEELNGYKISQDLDTLLKGVSVKVKEAETDGTHYEDTLHSLEVIQNLMEGNTATPNGEKEPLDIFRISGDLSNEADSKYYDAIYASLDDFNNFLDTDRQMSGIITNGTSHVFYTYLCWLPTICLLPALFTRPSPKLQPLSKLAKSPPHSEIYPLFLHCPQGTN